MFTFILPAAAIAERVDATIELLPQVGDFVAKGDPLFRLYGPGAALTFPQDPHFAFRIIVDVASKALSPAINDPTTAVLAILRSRFSFTSNRLVR